MTKKEQPKTSLREKRTLTAAEVKRAVGSDRWHDIVDFVEAWIADHGSIEQGVDTGREMADEWRAEMSA
jgi:hypothetical protein